jgi:hypothetical protein
MTRPTLALCLLLVIAPLSRSEQPTQAEQPQAVDICELLASPGAYHHKLVRVTGRVSRGFEDFSLGGGNACADAKRLWLEYGGAEPAQVIFCCTGKQENPPNGKDPLYIDGIQTTLRRNSMFRRFDIVTRRLRRNQTVGTTLVGRVFAAGTHTSASGEQEDVGYGHFGLFSLFVIQQVVNVSER